MSRDSAAGRARRRHHATRPEIQEANSRDEAQADAHGAEVDRAAPSEPDPDCSKRLLETQDPTLTIDRYLPINHHASKTG
jgi:hypothetical protein